MENLKKTRKVVLSMHISLDGYVEGPKGNMSWIVDNSSDEWEILFEDLKNTDVFITGSKMYDGYAGFWKAVLNKPSPFSDDFVKYARIAEATEHILVSAKGHEPKWENTRVTNDLVGEIISLKQKPGKDICVWGGATTASFLINNNMIDEYRLTVCPVVLGGGKSLFANAKKRINLRLLNSVTLQGGLVLLKYSPCEE